VEPPAREAAARAVRRLGHALLAHEVDDDHLRRVERFADAWQREEPGLTEDQALARAEVMLGALTGLGMTALVDPGFDMRAHARQLLPSHQAVGFPPSA